MIFQKLKIPEYIITNESRQIDIIRRFFAKRDKFSSNGVHDMGTLTYLCTMRIISRRTLREFWNLYPDVENQLLGWYKVMEAGSFYHSNDILESFPFSRSIGANRYVFKIKGNQYRLIVKINFDLQTVWVRFVGTHLQYDNIDALTI